MTNQKKYVTANDAADLLTPQEVAEHLRISVWSVYRMAGSKLPCIRISRKALRFTEQDVEKFIKSRRMGI